MPLLRPGFPATTLLAACLVVAGGAASAQTYTGQMALSQSVERDDNPLLRSASPKAVVGSITTPEATIIGDTQSAKVELDTRVVENRYSDEALSSTDAYLRATSSYRGDVTTLGLAAALDYDTTLTSELTGSGLVEAGVRHMQWSAAPNLDIKLSPVDQASAVLSYARTEYNSTLYSNYEEWGVVPSYSHSFTPRDIGRIKILATRYATLSGPASQINSLGAVAGWDRQVSERFKLAGFVGPRFSATRDGVGAATSWGYLGDIALDYEGQQDHLRLGFDRNLEPLGTGTQVQADQIDGLWVHAVNTLTFAEFRLQYIQQSALDNSPDQNRTYYSIEPRLRFQLTDAWALTPVYRLRHQTTGPNNDKADSQTFLLTIGYRGGKFGLD